MEGTLSGKQCRVLLDVERTTMFNYSRLLGFETTEFTLYQARRLLEMKLFLGVNNRKGKREDFLLKTPEEINQELSEWGIDINQSMSKRREKVAHDF
jgi:hypothetical protein